MYKAVSLLTPLLGSSDVHEGGGAGTDQRHRERLPELPAGPRPTQPQLSRPGRLSLLV